MIQSTSSRRLATTAILGTAAASSGHAAIITGSPNVELDNRNEALFIDLDTSDNFSQSDTTGKDFSLRFYNNVDFYQSTEQAKGRVDRQNSGSSWSAIVSGSDELARYASGDTLTGTFVNFTAWTEFDDANSGGNWDGFTGVAYMGFTWNGEKGWVEIDYNAGNPSGGSMTVLSYAWGSAGEITQAGVNPIPEPGAAGAVAALLAGSAVAYQRRKKKSA
ncbi:MAG: hypothetical protein ACFE0O_01715 [Opitutales bacterium]